MNQNSDTIYDTDLKDIREIRDANSARHIKMTPAEIIADINSGAQRVLRELAMKKPTKLLFEKQ